MPKVLYIQASPRGHRSKSIAVADAFIDSYRESNPSDHIDTLNLFEADLMAFDALAVQAKYTVLHGRQHTPEELSTWRQVEAVTDRFKSADKLVIAAAMWNFNIPYRLKQYIDIIVQPGLTFSYSPDEGYKGLVVDRPAFIACARGAEYSSPESQALDFQKGYLETILGFIGFSDIQVVLIEPTLAGGPDVAAERLAQAIEEAKGLAKDF